MKKALVSASLPILRKLAFVIVRTAYYIEHSVVLLFEAFLRIRGLLDPRLHSEARRIRKITDGRARKDTGKFIVFVVYSEAALPAFTTNFVDAIRQSPFNLILVANSRLAPQDRERLLGGCALLIERENVGQDFGGYKDGISVALSRFPDLNRLAIANDSVYYLDCGLDRLLAGLDGDADFIGVSEVLDHHYHVASFLVSFGPRVLQSPEFQEFWQRYRPFGTRRWAIFQGEGALTAHLVRAGFRPHVLFRAEALRPHLEAQSASQLADTIMLLPPTGRRLMVTILREAGLDAQAAMVKAMGAGVPGATISGPTQPFVDAIVATIMARNQMHMGGFLFHRFLGLPAIKRDIFFRQIHGPDDTADALADVGAPLRQEIMRDLGRRGTTADFGLWKKVLSRHSAA